ncbi:hypothetical protein H0H92_004401 [Tricholoma furcatifolium]|nr:hypothetical protein H0H92_004401 [Tricholoma furcatifolium]
MTTALSVFKDQERRFTFKSLILSTRLWNDSLSVAENFCKAKDLSKRFLLHTARRAIFVLRSLDYITLGNIAFRASVRALTPGHDLRLLEASDAFFKVSSDIALVTFARHSLSTLPSPETSYDVNLSLALPDINLSALWLPNRVHSLEDLEYEARRALAMLPSIAQVKIWLNNVNLWFRTALAHTDTSALVSLGVHATVNWYGHPDAIDIHTTYTMVLMDDLMNLVCKDHHPPFHRFGEVLRSIDGVFPGLELSSLTDGLPHPAALGSAGKEGSVSPLVPSTSPLSEASNEEVICPKPEVTQSDHEKPLVHRPQGLSGYVIAEEDCSSVLRDISSVLISFLAGFGVTITVGKRFIALKNAELARKIPRTQELVLPPIETPLSLLEILSSIKGAQNVLPPGYNIAITSKRTEKQIAIHVTKLVRALTPARRRELVQVLGIAFPPPATPDVESSTTPKVSLAPDPSDSTDPPSLPTAPIPFPTVVTPNIQIFPIDIDVNY